jgi:putative transcription factor
MEDIWNTHTVLVNKQLIKENKKKALKENGEIIKKTKRENTSKLDSHEESFTHKKINKKISDIIREGRCKKGMKQKDLAGKLNIANKTIIMYENGSAIPDNNLMGKIERILNIKIRGII